MKKYQIKTKIENFIIICQDLTQCHLINLFTQVIPQILIFIYLFNFMVYFIIQIIHVILFIINGVLIIVFNLVINYLQLNFILIILH